MKRLTRAETAAWLKSHDHYRILTHRKPDGDTVGSAAALCRGLRAMGKQAYILPNPELTPRYSPFHQGLTAPEPEPGDILLSVDTATAGMLSAVYAGLAEQVALAIDHHPSNSGYAENTLLEPEAAACGEIIYSLLEELGVTLDPEMADALYVAVSTDTGCFRYSNTTARTLRTAAACADAGAALYSLNQMIFETRRLSRLKLESYMTEHLELYGGGRVAFCLIPAEVERKCGIQEDDMESVATFARNVEGVELAVTMRTEASGGTKLSVRCAPGYNASALCAAFGGGGHAAAAGARTACPQTEARDRMLAVMKEQGYL